MSIKKNLARLAAATGAVALVLAMGSATAQAATSDTVHTTQVHASDSPLAAVTDVLGGLPLVGGLTGGFGGITDGALGGLPLVGGLAGGLTGGK